MKKLILIIGIIFCISNIYAADKYYKTSTKEDCKTFVISFLKDTTIGSIRYMSSFDLFMDNARYIECSDGDFAIKIPEHYEVLMTSEQTNELIVSVTEKTE